MAAPEDQRDWDKAPPVDPTKNVLDLVQAAIQRQDDLREAAERHAASAGHHAQQMADLRGHYDALLRQAETDRIDAIRAVDVGAVQRAAEVQATQASTLAAQVAAQAEALRVSFAGELEPIRQNIATLQKAQYEQAGGVVQSRENKQDTQHVRQSSQQNIGIWIAVAGVIIAAAVFAVALLGRG